MHKIRTFTGKLINPIEASLEEIDIRDIAHALARMPRFGGHTPYFYSVAQHCLRCVELCQDTVFALEMLLHDATEAYLMDMPKPIKNQLPDYVKAEKKLANVIDIKFGLYSVMFHEQIKAIDEQVLQEELWHLWNQDRKDPALPVPTNYQGPEVMSIVEKEFLNKFNELYNKVRPTKWTE